MTALWQNIALGTGAAFVLFGLTWALSRRVNNYSLVDVTWSYALIPLLAIYATGTQGDATRKLLIGLMGTAWALRLGTHLLLRVRAHHPGEDVRYAVLRGKWRDRPGMKFFLFFQAQAALIVLLSLPHLLAMGNPEPGIRLIEWTGLGIWFAGMIGESAADRQLRRFKADPANRGGVCAAGLWRYSRHPNYFFESVVWWGFWLFACGSPWGWVTIYAPLLMLHFLLRVTGIPLTEKCAVEKQGRCLPRLPADHERVRAVVPEANACLPFMSLTDTLLEKDLLPDPLIRLGIRRRLASLLREKRPADVEARQAALRRHLEGLDQSPVAIETDAANEQHYEVPTRFFELCLGKHLKYSSGSVGRARAHARRGRGCDAAAHLRTSRAWRTDSASSSWAAAGARSRSGWRRTIRARRSPASRTRAPRRPTSMARPRNADSPTSRCARPT